MWDKKFKRSEENWDGITSDMLSFVYPSLRENPIQGMHVKQDCPSFGVLGKVR